MCPDATSRSKESLNFLREPKGSLSRNRPDQRGGTTYGVSWPAVGAWAFRAPQMLLLNILEYVFPVNSAIWARRRTGIPLRIGKPVIKAINAIIKTPYKL